MKRTFAFRDGKCVEITPDHVKELHYVQDDIKQFRSPDGAVIEGKSQWREHLKRTGTVEMSHADIKAGEKVWSKRKRDFAEKLASGEKYAKPVDVPVLESRDYERSRLNTEMANKLYNRPAPSRTELLKLTWDTAQDLRRRK